MKDILVTRDSKSKIRIVNITCEWEETLQSYILRRKTSQYKGKVTSQPEIEIREGKAKRTITEQAQLIYDSHVKKYLDKGYKSLINDFNYNSLDDCDIEKLLPDEVTDQNGFRKPMLAKSSKDCAISVFEHDFYASRKLDGTRCMMHWAKDKIVTSSRGGGNYDIPATYIINNTKLIAFLKSHPNCILDGELYIHGRSLPYISGLCRLQTLDPRHTDLKYYIYDIAVEDILFKDRLKILEELQELVAEDDNFIVVEHISVNSWGKMKKLHDAFVKEGYEGCVIRNPDKDYGFNKRDNRMVKIKEFEDSEFEILGLVEGLRPEDMCFLLKADNGETFKAKPVGDRALKDWYRKNITDIIGKYGTVKYFGLTPYGVPNLPVFKSIRDILE